MSIMSQSNIGLLEAFIGNKKNNLKWEEMDYTKEIVKFVPLVSSSLEYLQIKNNFDESMGRFTYPVTKIERIQNPYLLSAYEIKKAEILHRFNCVSERVLYHGTSAENAELICLNNFDWRLNGSGRGHKFGRGVSFSPKASYSRHYCGFPRVIIVSYILQALSHIGNETTMLPLAGYDTTKKSTGDVIVKYEDSEFYPAYKIFF